ncbi:MAG: MlaD family protein [Vicinamibacterales bacterium]
MPRTRSLAWAELRIGILAVAAISLVSTLIFMLGGQGGFFWQRYSIKTTFPNALGLKSGAVVRLAGVEVGSVSDVRFAGSAIEVTLEVARTMQARITTESRATIGSLSLLGDSTVDLTVGASGTPIPEGGSVEAAPATPALADVASKAYGGLDEVSKLLVDLRGGKGTLGKLVTDEAMYAELTRLLTSTETVVGALNKGRGTLGKLINDPVAYRELQGALQEIHTMTAQVNAGQGSLGRLLKDDTLAKSAGQLTQNLTDVTEKMKRGEGTAGKLLTDEGLYTRLDGLIARLDGLTTGLTNGEGTAGRLLHDEQLYDNMNHTVGEMRQLIAEIRANPKKYLNVRVSIF